MPELPEVETTAKSIEPLLGNTIKSVSVFQSKLRWQVPSDLDALVGATITDISRRAKYLIIDTKKEGVSKKLIIHLGMSGSLQQRETQTDKLKHDHVIFHFTAPVKDQNIKLCYHDPRRFGAILWYDEYASKLFDHLGPEPLSDNFNANYLLTKLKKTARPVKSVIMDQACVVGVGNIYATESLFLSGIHPLTEAKKVTKKQVGELVAHIKEVLANAIALGGSTLRDYTHSDGKTGYFQQTLLVYGRKGEVCTVCNSTIENVQINNRASCFCPSCQPKKRASR